MNYRVKVYKHGYLVPLAVAVLLWIFLLLILSPIIPPSSKWQKSVTWADGSRETIQITDKGKIYLNGKEIIAFGFHAKHGVPNPSDTIANAMLDRLQKDGVRFMTINFANWETFDQCYTDMNFWFPKLYAHKMWVNVQVQYREVEPPRYDVAFQFDKHKMIIDYISTNDNWANMVFTWNDSWEDDLFWHGEDIFDSYLSQLYTTIKNFLPQTKIGSVPILSKATGVWTVHPVTISQYKHCDFMGRDYYVQFAADGTLQLQKAKDEAELLHSSMMPLAGKVGTQIYYTEVGYGGAGASRARFVDQKVLNLYLTDFGYNDCSLVMMWMMWSATGPQWFNPDGTPTIDYANLATQFPKI